MQLPSLNGNWVDLIISVFIFSLVLSSLDKGFIINLIDLLSFVLSFVISLKFYSLAAGFLTANFSLPLGIAKILGFILLGFISEAVFLVVVRFIYKAIPKEITNSSLNKLLGPLPAIINGLIMVAFFLTVVIAMPITPQIKKAIFDSKIGGPVVARTQIVETELAKIFGEAISDTLQFITIAPESSEKVNLQFTTTKVSVDEEAERQMFVLVNNERTKASLKPLTADENLKEVARAHAKDMFARGYFSHINPEGLSPFDRLEKAGINFTAAGENLAFAPTVELAHQGLMQSTGHRANILSVEFAKVGIGVIDGGVFGKMFVQDFTN